ncbi:hypothetical protein T11_470 [Trichinella zimbabwensis]|uniref:Uncharacterized protein n=1 Tax=Trichinella zimbabwensis TaxID=268475 RepID=A0A0V1GL93_9BILA|nr:hypothetical protein T11_470 [Trichinella zimbabwensis]
MENVHVAVIASSVVCCPSSLKLVSVSRFPLNCSAIIEILQVM